MSRPLRLEFPGAVYHVTSRGDRREDIFDDDIDRKTILSVLDRVCDTYNWVCYAYCLMSNHYHLLIETPDGNLSKGMRQLNGVYTQTYNRIHGRSGHVFQGRYKAVLVERESYLLELSRYIVLNPVRAGTVRSAREWRWSSYRATAGQNKGPDCLNIEWLLANFGHKREVAVERYKTFVSEGQRQPSPWGFLRNQIYLGSEQFVEKMQAFIADDKEGSEVPLSQRRPEANELVYYEASFTERNSAINQAYRRGGYTLKEIGDYFGLHCSAVSGIIRNHKSKT
jgi:REP element-mobilizing transposase RayT